jgi:hypothetical protein
MGIVMNMSSYEIEQDPMGAEYGEEVMCSGWNPAVALMCQQVGGESASRLATMPASLATVDAEAFLQKMYAYQR